MSGVYRIMKHRFKLFSPGMYDSTYICDECGMHATFSVDAPEIERYIRQTRCPVGERTRKIIRQIAVAKYPEETLRRQYGFTKAKFERFKEKHEEAIRYHETKIYQPIFDEL